MATLIGEMQYLTIGGSTYSIPQGGDVVLSAATIALWESILGEEEEEEE